MLEAFSKFLMKFAKQVLLFSVVVMITYFLGMKMFGIGHQLFFEYSIEPKPGRDIEFTINRNDGLDDITNNLYNLGLIDNKTVFKFRAIGYKTNFVPNTYRLNTSMTIKNILTIFDKNIAIETTQNDEVSIESESQPQAQ